MGSRSSLKKSLRVEKATGTLHENARDHEIARQNVIKEILAHIFLMSKFKIIDPILTVGKATSQYFWATGDNQAAHCAPGQIYHSSVPIQRLITGSDELSVELDALFGKTTDQPAKFNKADSRAEENDGIRAAFGEACRKVAESGKYSRFNHGREFYPQLATAYGHYKALAVRAYDLAISVQNRKAHDLWDSSEEKQKRLETIEILRTYREELASSPETHETVQGLIPELLWKRYRDAVR